MALQVALATICDNSFCKNKERKDTQRQDAKSGDFAALRRLTQEGNQNVLKSGIPMTAELQQYTEN